MKLFEFAVDTLAEARLVFNQIDLIGLKSFDVEDDGSCDPRISVRVRHELMSEDQLKDIVRQLPRGVYLVTFITQFKR